MATPAAILSVLVDANTTEATSKLTKFDRQLAATNDAARKGIQARLGARYDPVAFKEYQAALDKASLRAKDRAAFKAELGANFNPTAFREYQAAIAKANAESERATKLTAEQSAQLQGIRTRTKQAAEGVLGIAAASVYAAVKFQSATATLQTQAGASTKQVDKLRQGILKMAGDVGQTPDALAKGMYHVVSSMNALLPPAKRVADELHIQRVAAEGAAVGHTDLEETTYALASAMNALHAPVTSARKIMGQMNAIVGAGDMTMTDLLDTMKSGLVPAARTFGISFRSVGAALAVMGDMGIRGADAGTKLRMSIALLGAPSSKAASILKAMGLSTDQVTAAQSRMSDLLVKAGVSTTQLSNDLRKPNGLSAALTDLKKHLEDGGLSAEAAAATISRAFGGGRSGATIQLLTQNTDRLDKKFQQIGQTAGNFGDAFAKTQKTAQFQLHALEGTAVALGVQLGNMLLPTVVKVAGAIRTFVEQIQSGKGAGGEFAAVVVSAFKAVRDVVTSVVGVVGGFGNAVKILIGAFVAAKIYDVVKAISALRVALATSGVGAFLAVVGGLATAFGLLSSSQSDAAVTARDVANAWNAARSAAKNLRDAGLQVVQAKLDLANASQSEQDAQRAVNKLEAEGKTGTQEYKDAVLNLKDAQLQHTRAQNEVKDATDNAKQAQQKATQATQDAIQKDGQRVESLKAQIKWLNVTGGSQDDIRKKMAQLDSATTKLNADQSSLNRAYQAMPDKVNTTVSVAVDFLSNVPGAIAAIGRGAVKGVSQVVGHATGGMVNKPGYFAGEEAPRHPEVILATNPAYRKRNVKLWQQAGGMLGIPGFAEGGFPYASAGAEVRRIDPWTARQAMAWIKPLAQAWGAQHSMAGRMIHAANSITGLPYTWGGGHAGFFGSPGFDCSGAVSYVLHAGNLLASPMTTDGLKVWGDPGPGKQITVGVRGTTGPNAHTMMEMFGKFFESGGAGGGPHWDAGWDGTFPILRHPPGFAMGGVFRKGDFGDVPPSMLLAMNPSLISNPKFFDYLKHAPRFAQGGWFNAVNHQYPKHYTGTPGATLSPMLVAKIAEWAGMPGITMAQIAHGESSYMPGIVQAGQDYAHTGWGLWQITPGNSVPSVGINEQLLNPIVNARAAAVKYGAAKRAGLRPLSPWFGTKYLTDPNKHYTGGGLPPRGANLSARAPRAPRVPTIPKTTVQGKNPAAQALLGPLNKTVGWLAGMAGIPSQGIAGQVTLAGLTNQLGIAQAEGSIPRQEVLLGQELKLERAWLLADKAKLQKVNKALRRKDLSRKGRQTLLQDKLALLQEIGTVEGNIGTAVSSLEAIVPTDTPGGTADTSSIDAQTQAIEAQTQAMQSLQAALDANVHYMQSVGAVETSQAIKALSDVISGQIGGRAYSRMTGSAGDGSVARYGSVSRA